MGTECAAALDRWSGISDFKAANVRCIRLSSEPLVFRAYIPKHKHARPHVSTDLQEGGTLPTAAHI